MSKVHEAIAELYPEAVRDVDYLWVTPVIWNDLPPVVIEGGEQPAPVAGPPIQKWNEAKLGPLDLAAIEAKAAELAGRPPPPPETISDRQFFQALALEGTITQAEAKAAVKTGEIPAAMQAFIASLPEAEQFGAEMIVAGATTFERSHPLTEAIRLAQGRSPEQLDAFWRTAAAL